MILFISMFRLIKRKDERLDQLAGQVMLWINKMS